MKIEEVRALIERAQVVASKLSDYGGVCFRQEVELIGELCHALANQAQATQGIRDLAEEMAVAAAAIVDGIPVAQAHTALFSSVQESTRAQAVAKLSSLVAVLQAAGGAP